MAPWSSPIGPLEKPDTLSRVRLFATPWTVAHQAPPSMGFSRQEYWSGFPFPSPGIFPTQGSKLGLLHCRQILVKTVTRTHNKKLYSCFLLGVSWFQFFNSF